MAVWTCTTGPSSDMHVFSCMTLWKCPGWTKNPKTNVSFLILGYQVDHESRVTPDVGLSCWKMMLANWIIQNYINISCMWFRTINRWGSGLSTEWALTCRQSKGSNTKVNLSTADNCVWDRDLSSPVSASGVSNILTFNIGCISSHIKTLSVW